MFNQLRVDNKIINALGFKTTWWSLALYKQQAIWVACLFLFLHFLFLNKERAKEVYFVGVVSFLGMLMDSLLFYVHFFKDGDFVMAPLWLVALWPVFAVALKHCLSWLFHNKKVCFILGGLGGALSYLGASQLGTLVLPYSWSFSFSILFFIWGSFLILVRSFYLFHFEIKELA